MVTLAALTSVFLQLLPVGVWMWMRSRRDRALWEVALDIPSGVAIDTLGVLLLTRLFHLETAVLASRVIWLVAAVVFWVRRRRCLPVWPRSLDGGACACAAVAATLAVALSMEMSRACHNFDRGWHIPLVSSLRGQSLPFMNVYQPTQPLEYHYTGDSLASSLQVLSFNVLHASYALSLAHDMLFGLTAVTAALLFRYLGTTRVYAVLGSMAILTAGPLTVLSEHGSRSFAGYSFINFYKLSFRPHYPLSALMVIGFVGAIVVRLRERDRPPPVAATALVLVACTALQTLTDEASIGLLGAAVGVTWLFIPQCLHERRLYGALILVGLLVAVLLPHPLLAGTLSPGAVANKVELVPWRSPGYYSKVLPLSTEAGRSRLYHDILPMAAVAAGAALSLVRPRGREHAAAVLFFSVLLGLSIVGLCRIEVVADVPAPPKGGWAVQNHRFVTAAMLIAPAVAVWLATLPKRGGRGRGVNGVSTALMLGAVALGSVSTIQWLLVASAKKCFRPKSFDSPHDFYALDCRRETGARLGASAHPTYAAKALAYTHAGCHPSFLAGRQKRLTYRLKVGGAAYGRAALEELQGFIDGKSDRLLVICPRGSDEADPACLLARRAEQCAPAGHLEVRCELHGPVARELLREALADGQRPAPAEAPVEEPDTDEEP